MPLNLILGITVNQLNDEFIIHGKDIEYDHYYSSQKRNEIIKIIYQAYCKLNLENFIFTILKEKSLKTYVTKKKDKKSNPSFTRMRTDRVSKIEDFLEQKFLLPNGILKHNEEEGPHFFNNTVYSAHKSIKSINIEDLKVLKVISKRSFRNIYLVEYLPTHEKYVLKNYQKDFLIEHKEIILFEKDILQKMEYPFLSNLVFFFETNKKIHFVTSPFLSGGGLIQYIRKYKTLKVDIVRFFGAQIALALDYLHKKGFVFFDFSIENILMDKEGYLHLYGIYAKKFLYDEYSVKSHFIPNYPINYEYLAPELISKGDGDRMANWWTFGIILFEMLCGVSPFYEGKLEKTYDMILNNPVRFPERFDFGDDAKNIIVKLLEKNPEKRLGFQKGIEEIKNHPFFEKIDFNDIEQKNNKTSISS